MDLFTDNKEIVFIKDKNISITGKLSMPKNEAYTIIARNGGIINLNVNHKTDILITGELKISQSKKLSLAKKYSIAIMTENEIFSIH